jgi:hypothetical protein
VTDEFAEEGVGDSCVSVEDCLVAGARAEDGGVPCDCAYSVCMALHQSYSFHFVYIPNLDFTYVGA